jgi:ubiquinone/menaquinone biosynthesis C-methylase UbiE
VSRVASSANIDRRTVEGFGDEWTAYDQGHLAESDRNHGFAAYFTIFPFETLPPNPEGFDFGCGSGRWAAMVKAKVGLLHCVDASAKALQVCRSRLGDRDDVEFHLAGPDTIPLADESQDFGYSLGVLHHIPDTEAALAGCAVKLKRGAPFLVYLYYDFENRPWWFRGLWRASELVRAVVSKLPFGARKALTTLIAATVYWPLARSAGLVERCGGRVEAMPLSYYRNLGFYTMRTDALDRFGTRLEQRFSRAEIRQMMERSGLTNIRFSDAEPYWVACGVKA